MFPMAYYKTRYNLKDRAVTLLNMVGLKDMMDYRPYQLTIEEQIRVSIAQALIDSPEYLIIDDLFEKTDSAILENIIELLKELNEKGQTILFITNNFESGSKVGTVVYFKNLNMKSNMMSFEL
jgi:putative ABC transport system ATP-binding protein